MQDVAGYRIEHRPGEYVYYTPDEYRRENYKGYGEIRSLHTTPQSGYPSEPEIYRGWCWIKDTQRFGWLDDNPKPLYLGGIISNK